MLEGKKNMSQQIIDYIFGQIKEGKLKPGDKLTNERELCETLGVSRPPLREALKSLTNIGILIAKQGGGTYVNEYNGDYIKSILKFVLVFSDQMLFDYVQMRKAIESEATKLATKLATEDELDKLKEIIEQREDLSKKDFKENRDKLKQLDFKFHLEIARMSGNTVFYEFIKGLSRALSEHQNISAIASKTPDSSNSYHRKIYNAMIDRHAELASLIMYEHIQNIEAAILSKIIKNNTKKK